MLSKQVTKSKIGSKSFNLTKNFTQPKFQPKFNVFFSTANFLALTILQPKTVKLNVTKNYILVDVVGVLALGSKYFYAARS